MTWTCQERPKHSSGCAVAGRSLPSLFGKMMNMLTTPALLFVALVFLFIYTFDVLIAMTEPRNFL